MSASRTSPERFEKTSFHFLPVHEVSGTARRWDKGVEKTLPAAEKSAYWGVAVGIFRHFLASGQIVVLSGHDS
jgi:hypothetical protein